MTHAALAISLIIGVVFTHGGACAAVEFAEAAAHGAHSEAPVDGGGPVAAEHGSRCLHQELPDLLAAADVVVGRSGAGTVAELTALGKACILIPYPVIAEGANEESWWREPGNLRLLVAEYVKYLAALIEVRIAPRVTDEDPAQKTKT